MTERSPEDQAVFDRHPDIAQHPLTFCICLDRTPDQGHDDDCPERPGPP